MKVYGCPKGYEAPELDFDADWQAEEAAHTERLKQHLIESGHNGKYTGEVVSFPVADGSAQYMLVEGSGRYGKRAFLIHLPYGDGYNYGGIEHFPKADIIKKIEQQRAMAQIFRDRTDWWEARAVGETVHYHNGFGQYVRGEIVETAEGKVMKPTALVGPWAKSDLPNRRIDGEVHYPYHARKIMEGETMKPNATNMFENPDHTDRGVDPTKLDAIDLTVPEMNAEERELARLYNRREDAIDLLKNARTVEDFKRSFANARAVLDIAE